MSVEYDYSGYCVLCQETTFFVENRCINCGSRNETTEALSPTDTAPQETKEASRLAEPSLKTQAELEGTEGASNDTHRTEGLVGMAVWTIPKPGTPQEEEIEKLYKLRSDIEWDKNKINILLLYDRWLANSGHNPDIFHGYDFLELPDNIIDKCLKETTCDAYGFLELPVNLITIPCRTNLIVASDKGGANAEAQERSISQLCQTIDQIRTINTIRTLLKKNGLKENDFGYFRYSDFVRRLLPGLADYAKEMADREASDDREAADPFLHPPFRHAFGKRSGFTVRGRHEYIETASINVLNGYLQQEPSRLSISADKLLKHTQDISIRVLPDDVKGTVVWIIGYPVTGANAQHIVGQADTPGRCAFVTFFYFMHNFGTEKFPESLAKAVIHEIGHNFGLGHCRNRCVMTPIVTSQEKILLSLRLIEKSNFVYDYRSHRFCDQCIKIYGRRANP